MKSFLVLVALSALVSVSLSTTIPTPTTPPPTVEDKWNGWTWQNPDRKVQEDNKILVTEFYQKVFGDLDFDVIDSDKYLGEKYIQHNPLIKDGRKGLQEAVHSWLKDAKKTKLDIKRVGADGDLVWLHVRLNLLGKDHAAMDLFRVEDGKIIEHWDVLQVVPEKAENDNTMF